MSNQIHPTAVIGDGVVIGNNNQILAFTVIEGPCEIGDNNIIGPHAVIGSPGENSRDPRYDSSNKKITIGSGNIIREFCVVHKPAIGEITSIGDNNFVMHGSHIGHDCILKNNIVLSPAVYLGGHSVVLDGANLGMCSVTHQFTVVGHYAFIAMTTKVVKNIQPFAKYLPGIKDVNVYALNKYGLSEFEDEVRTYYLQNTRPTSDKILEIVDEYEYYHELSHRKEF